ncbi:MAG: PaaI family thioesterase [Thermodesulfobacteriota bacterium]
MRVEQSLLDRINENSLYRTLGIVVEEAAEGLALSRLTPEPAVCWPFARQPHGGILFTQMDTTMAWAVLTLLDSGLGCATINLDIQYTRPALGDRFLCTARVVHRTKRLAFVQAQTADPEGRVLALGQATFRIIAEDPLLS